MCIICRGEIYDLDTREVLDFSYCNNLTSEKLQKILIQCKNLKELGCNSCTSLTSLDLRSNINLKELYCNSCTSLTSLDLRNNINLKELYCNSCTSLTSLDLRNNSEGVTSFGCINLKKLYCNSCTSLTSLDLRSNINLVTLKCSRTSLISIDLRSNIKLKELNCSFCKSLTSLDLRNNINLKKLRCFDCKYLTSLDLPKKYKGCINHSDCYWIIQNKYFSINLQRLIRIQRWYRRTLIIKYMKSNQFIEWIYNPSNIGGRLYKKWLLKNLK